MPNKSLLHELERDLFFSELQVERIFSRAPYAYKQYTIPKRSGGVRTISQPAKETKYVQAWLIENVFAKLPVHECATAYKKGSSIKINAIAHVKNPYLIKFDFRDFFTSIKEVDLIGHLSSYLAEDYSLEDIRRMARISCIKYKHASDKCLSIGAPSSPILSNSILYEFDSSVSGWCSERNIVYTRYADDLTFSMKEKGLSSSVESQLRDFVKTKCLVSLRFNTKKTAHLSKKFQRRITGLIIANNDKVSLGRDRKREIKALVHRFELGLLDEKSIKNLQGLLGFAKDVEPDFILSLYEKYSFELVNKILRLRK